MVNHDWHDNELEHLLRRELGDHAPEAPDQLWTEIETRLTRQPRRRPVLWWWLLGIGAAAALAGAFQRFEAEKIPQPLQPNNQQQADFAQPLAAEPNGFVSKNFAEKAQSAKHAPASVPPFSALQTPASAGVFSEKTQPSVGSPFLGKQLESGVFQQKEDVPPMLVGKRSIALFDVLPHRAWAKPERPQPILFVSIVPKPKSKLPLWDIGLLAGPVWAWQSSHSQGSHQMGQTTFYEQTEGAATGWQSGVSASLFFTPKWGLSTGVLRRTATQNSGHQATLRLMDGVCLNPADAGPKEYEFQYALHSGGSAANVTIRIAQVDSSSAMPADEPFTLGMQTTRRSTDWLLPLAVQRRFGRGRLRGFVQGGGQLALPERTAVQVHHFTEQCADLCFSTGHLPTLTVAERGKMSLSWLLGAGMEYRIAPRWGLAVAPTFFGKKGQTGLSLNAGLHLKL